MKPAFYAMIAVTAITTLLTGCSSIAVMKPVAKIELTDKSKALVNVVRPRIFIGDGANMEAWDGNNFIGTLEAGTMLQYVTTPGEHMFMVASVQGGKWAHRAMNLQAGEVYYIKPNTQPFVGLALGAAEPTDPRIVTWKAELTPMAIDTEQTKEIPKEKIDEATRNWNEFKTK